MLLNVDRLQKQLDKDEFQEDGSMTAFWVVNNQFQNFIDSKFTLDYDSQMTDTRFVQYTGIEVQHFRDTLLQHLGNVKKSVAERTRHKRQYERRVNKRQMQTQESEIDTGQQHTEQPEIINEGRVDQYPETCQVKSPMLDSSPDNQTTEYSKQSLESKTTELTTSLLLINAELKAQIQEKVFAIAALKNDLRKLKGNSVDTKFDKTSVLGKPVLPSLRNQSVVRQPNAFKSERASKVKTTVWPSQVDVNNNLSKPVTQHYFPKGRESAFAKPDHVIASSESRNSSKNMPRFSSNDMVPTGKIFTPSTTKVDSEPPNGSNADITNQYESTQTLDVSAGTSNLSAGTSFNPKKEELRVWLLKRLISEKPGLHGIFI
ncbi:hypothetical protein Tco_1303277 [Tanacetum coccineum]